MTSRPTQKPILRQKATCFVMRHRQSPYKVCLRCTNYSTVHTTVLLYWIANNEVGILPRPLHAFKYPNVSLIISRVAEMIPSNGPTRLADGQPLMSTKQGWRRYGWWYEGGVYHEDVPASNWLRPRRRQLQQAAIITVGIFIVTVRRLQLSKSIFHILKGGY